MPLELTDSQDKYTTAVQVSLSAISLFSIVLYFAFLFWYICWHERQSPRKLHHNTAIQLISLLLFGVAIKHIGNVMGDAKDGSTTCTVSGFLISFGGLYSFCWISFLSLTVFKILDRSDKRWHSDTIDRNKKIMFIVTIVFCLICSLIPINDYGTVGAWCWIKPTGKGEVYRYVFYYVWLWLAFVFCAFNSIVFAVNAYKGGSSYRDYFENQTVKRVFLFPIAFFVSFLFAVIHRLWDFNGLSTVPFAIVMLHAIGASLFGFVCVLCFGYVAYDILKKPVDDRPNPKEYDLADSSAANTTVDSSGKTVGRVASMQVNLAEAGDDE